MLVGLILAMTSIRVSEDSLFQALSKLAMGCICAKESIVLDGVTYRILEQIAEGCVFFLTRHALSSHMQQVPCCFQRLQHH